MTTDDRMIVDNPATTCRERHPAKVAHSQDWSGKMWRRIAWSLTLGICVIVQLQADVFAQVATRPLSLLNRTNAAQFEIVLGRITATNIRPGPARSQSLSNQSNGCTESLTIGFQGQIPTVHYEYASPEQRLVVDLNREQEVSIHHIPYENVTKDYEWPAAEVAFHQDVRGRTRLIVHSNDAAHAYQATSVWHLVLSEPLVSRLYLIPLLQQLRTNWDVGHIASELRLTLLNFPRNHALPDRTRIDALVLQLGNKSFKQRQAADRELRQLGPAVIPYLQSIDPLSVDSEQRSRIRGVLSSMQASSTSDTLERVVNLLAGDKTVWLMFLGAEDPQSRELAASQLGQLMGRPLDFDPTAPAEKRAAQIASLRKMLVRE